MSSTNPTYHFVDRPTRNRQQQGYLCTIWIVLNKCSAFHLFCSQNHDYDKAMHVVKLYLSTTLDMEKAFSSIFTTNKKRTAMPNVPSGLIGLISAIIYQLMRVHYNNICMKYWSQYCSSQEKL